MRRRSSATAPSDLTVSEASWVELTKVRTVAEELLKSAGRRHCQHEKSWGPLGHSDQPEPAGGRSNLASGDGVGRHQFASGCGDRGASVSSTFAFPSGRVESIQVVPGPLTACALMRI